MLQPLLPLTLVAAQLLLAVTPLYCCHSSDGHTVILVGSGCCHVHGEPVHSRRCCQASQCENTKGEKSPQGDIVSQRHCVDLMVTQDRLAQPEESSSNPTVFSLPDVPVVQVDTHSAAVSLAIHRRCDDELLGDLALLVLRC